MHPAGERGESWWNGLSEGVVKPNRRRRPTLWKYPECVGVISAAPGDLSFYGCAGGRDGADLPSDRLKHAPDVFSQNFVTGFVRMQPVRQI